MLSPSNSQEIVNIDPDGNVWKIKMFKMDTKTNRYQLSFFFNEKEFSLSKLQSNRSASDTWELLQKIRKEPPMALAESQELPHIQYAEKQAPRAVKQRPTAVKNRGKA